MELYEAIAKRRSIRKYKPDEVEWDKIGEILYAAREAPSSGNLQNWRFLLMLDGGHRQAIAEACYGQLWMADAPVHIVLCADPEKVTQFYGLRGDRLYSAQNCAAAIQNMLLAAVEQGLGTCWVGAFDEEKIKDICAIPDNIRPQAIITLGYADEEPLEKPWKHDLYSITFMHEYGNRVKDPDHTLNYHSGKVHKAVDSVKEGAKKSGSLILDGIKTLKDRMSGNHPKVTEKQRK